MGGEIVLIGFLGILVALLIIIALLLVIIGKL